MSTVIEKWDEILGIVKKGARSFRCSIRHMAETPEGL